MPNQLTAAGLQTATQAELVTYFTTQFQSIYGADINLDSDTPDGQMMNIFIQSVLDLEDLLTQLYNMFDPDQAIGVILDQRVAINGIQRQAGTYSVTPILITTSQSVNLPGLDQDTQVPYTIADSAGNQWQLITSLAGFTTGTVNFQAATPGAVLTTPNTIIVPVSIILGVTSVNNPSTQTTIGVNEESDAQLKIRRQVSVSLSSQGYYAGLLAALKNISGVTFAFVEENTSNGTNGDGVPGHSIWVIVAGTGAAASIAQAIYTKRNAGCGMYNSGDAGAQTYPITQVDGTIFDVYWDTVITVNPFIAFYTASLNGTSPPNITAILAYLVSNFTPGVAAEVNINQLATLVQQADPNTLVTFPSSGTPSTKGFCLTVGGSYTFTLTPASKNKQFVVVSSNIIILPMQLSPYNSATAAPLLVPRSTSLQLTGLGGHGTLTYSLSISGSGGSINSSSGLYTAGSTPGASIDTALVTDGLGNTATAVITVT